MKAMASPLFAATIFYLRATQPAALGKSNPHIVKRRFQLLAVVLSVLVAIASDGVAQNHLADATDLSNHCFRANVLYFRDGASDRTITEVLVEIPYSSLPFQRVDDGYEANAEASVIFDDADGFQVDGDVISDKIRVDNFEATRSNSLARMFYLPFQVAPGSYAIRLMVGDERASNRYSYVCNINVPSFQKPQLKLSTLLLARQVEVSGDDSVLQKNGRSIIPNVPHVFAIEKPFGFVYFEVYNMEPAASPASLFQVHYRISRLGQELRSFSWNGSKPDTKAAVSLPLNLNGLEPGEYMLTVTVADPSGKREVSAFAVFYIAPFFAPTLGFFDTAAGLNN